MDVTDPALLLDDNHHFEGLPRRWVKEMEVDSTEGLFRVVVIACVVEGVFQEGTP